MIQRIAARVRKPTITSPSIESRMQLVLSEMDYDFSQFTLNGLIAHLAQRRQVKILCAPLPMPPYMFGAWISQTNPAREYIFYDNHLSVEHRAHTILHELAHWWRGHETLMVNRAQLAGMIQLLNTDSADVNYIWGQLARRSEGSNSHNQQEAEAEVLALLIQDEADKHRRWQQVKVGASDKDLRDILLGFGLVD